MSITRSMTSTSVLMTPFLALGALGRGLEAGELSVPERGEVRAELLERATARAIDAATTIPAERDETGVLEDPQVLRDRGPRDVEVRGDLADGPLLVPDETEDLPSSRLGDRAKGVIHRY